MDIHVHVHGDDISRSKLDRILQGLQVLKRQGRIIMQNEAEALELLTAIDEATTEQGTVLDEEATTLATIGSNLDRILAGPTTGIPDSVIEELRAQKTKVQAISASLKAQAEFSKAIAAKGATEVPEVPPATEV